MIINASAHNIPLADKSVHSVVTSPPYFGLRRYEGAQDVDWPAGVYSPMTGCPPCVEVPAMRCPLGNESTIEAFIWHLLLVMRELKRVLRDDGTCWVNLGDSYSGSGKGGNPENSPFQKQATNFGSLIAPTKLESEIAGGNLLAIPHRFALAAQADGWTLRNDCVWHKKSPMPESVSGWKWVRCRVKVSDTSRGKESFRVGAYERPQRDHDGNGGFAKAEMVDCPGCEDCQENGGYVLRKGSLRHTRAHEYVFQFVKQMGYYMDDANFKEMSKMPSDFADERVLFSQENWPSDFQMQDVLERSPHGVFPEREGQSGLSEVVFNGRQSRTPETATGIQENGSRQGRELEVREIGKRQSGQKALRPKRSSQAQEANGSCAQNVQPRIQRKDAGILAQEECRRVSQETSQEIHHISEGQASEIIKGSKIQEISAWIGVSQAEQHETKAASGKHGMHLDASGVDRDSEGAESSLLLLQEANGKTDSRPCNSSEQGRLSHERECGGGLPTVQSKERQSPSQRNPRSVLTPKPSSYKGAHFATFPKELIRPLILSSVPRRCCPECGQGWAAVVEGEKGWSKDCPKTLDAHLARGGNGIPVGTVGRSGSGRVDGFSVTTGYRPACDCGSEDYTQGIVLDPFVGSGTTLEVARECGVRAIGLDISHTYLNEQASWRGFQIAKPDFSKMPLFAEVGSE